MKADKEEKLDKELEEELKAKVEVKKRKVNADKEVEVKVKKSGQEKSIEKTVKHLLKCQGITSGEFSLFQLGPDWHTPTRVVRSCDCGMCEEWGLI